MLGNIALHIMNFHNGLHTWHIDPNSTAPFSKSSLEVGYIDKAERGILNLLNCFSLSIDSSPPPPLGDFNTSDYTFLYTNRLTHLVTFGTCFKRFVEFLVREFLIQIFPHTVKSNG